MHRKDRDTYSDDGSDEVGDLIIGLSRAQCAAGRGLEGGEGGGSNVEGGGKLVDERGDGSIGGLAAGQDAGCRRKIR